MFISLSSSSETRVFGRVLLCPSSCAIRFTSCEVYRLDLSYFFLSFFEGKSHLCFHSSTIVFFLWLNLSFETDRAPDHDRRCSHCMNHIGHDQQGRLKEHCGRLILNQAVVLKNNPRHKSRCFYASNSDHIETCGPCYFLQARTIINRAKNIWTKSPDKLMMSEEENVVLFNLLMEQPAKFIQMILPFWSGVKVSSQVLVISFA